MEVLSLLQLLQRFQQIQQPLLAPALPRHLQAIPYFKSLCVKSSGFGAGCTDMQHQGCIPSALAEVCGSHSAIVLNVSENF